MGVLKSDFPPIPYFPSVEACHITVRPPSLSSVEWSHIRILRSDGTIGWRCLPHNFPFQLDWKHQLRSARARRERASGQMAFEFHFCKLEGADRMRAAMLFVQYCLNGFGKKFNITLKLSELWLGWMYYVCILCLFKLRNFNSVQLVG